MREQSKAAKIHQCFGAATGFRPENRHPLHNRILNEEKVVSLRYDVCTVLGI